jgi:signal transduction histidine kinase/putative methionine-R-sulfoxide reductase with GAF domain
MLERVTAGDALLRVIRTLTERRPIDDILAEVLSQTRAMLAAAETYILIKSEDRLVVRASDGLVLGPDGRAWMRESEGVEGLTARTEEPVVASDLRHDARHVDPFDRAEAIGSMLVVPLVLRGKLLGVLASTRHQSGRFASVDTWWLEVFGGLVASVIASDQAYNVQERRARQAETLFALSTRDDTPPISQHTVDEVARAIGTAQCGILLFYPSRNTFELTSYRDEGRDKSLAREVTPEEAGALAEVIHTGRGFTCRNVGDDPTMRDVAFLRGAHSLVATPVRVSSEARGVLYAGTDEAHALDGDEAFLELVATRIGLMIERGELYERQREVERQQVQMEARQEFLGIVSHELKTPIAVMKAYTELLLKRAERAGRTAEIDVLRRMTDQSERMLAMIEQLLDLRRLEAGLLTFEESHFDLTEVIRRIAHEIELASGSHTIVVTSGGRAVIRADRRRIEEVFTNLIDNAVKYSPAGGTIHVDISQQRDPSSTGSIQVSVRDDGPGVALADRERVFERFFQAPGRLHKGHTGLGLGLFISRELARRHGGDIWIEPGPERGAQFKVKLPLAGPATPD